MCAPKNQIAQLALVAATAYATGGSSVFASGGATAATTATTTSSTLSTLANAARIALPVLGAAGQVYSGYMQARLANQKANFLDYQAGTEREASALRKVRRNRELLRAIGKQNALYGVAGVTLEDTPGDIIALTASNYQEDQFYDDYNTAQSILSKTTSAENYRSEAKNLIIGGYTQAATTLGTRGIDNLLSIRKVNVGRNSDITKEADIRTATEGSN